MIDFRTDCLRDALVAVAYVIGDPLHDTRENREPLAELRMRPLTRFLIIDVFEDGNSAAGAQLRTPVTFSRRSVIVAGFVFEIDAEVRTSTLSIGSNSATETVEKLTTRDL